MGSVEVDATVRDGGSREPRPHSLSRRDTGLYEASSLRRQVVDLDKLNPDTDADGQVSASDLCLFCEPCTSLLCPCPYESVVDVSGLRTGKTFHAYAPPFAQLVESPHEFSGSPMQIDTWNRDKMDINGTSPFVPGPYPEHALAPKEGPGAIYSGLLEW